MTNSTQTTDDRAGNVSREAHWIIAMNNGDQRVALRTLDHRIANAAYPGLAEFWRQVRDLIVTLDLGWSFCDHCVGTDRHLAGCEVLASA